MVLTALRLIGGVLLLVAGAVMLITPGPGLLAIVLGLTLIGTVYPPLGRWMHRMRRRLKVWWLVFLRRIGVDRCRKETPKYVPGDMP